MTPPQRWLARAAGTLFGRRYPFVLCYHGVGPISAEGDPAAPVRQPGAVQPPPRRDRRARIHAARPVADLWRLMQDGSDGDAHAPRSPSTTAWSGPRARGCRCCSNAGIPCSMFVSTGLMGKRHPDLDGAMIMTAAGSRRARPRRRGDRSALGRPRAAGSSSSTPTRWTSCVAVEPSSRTCSASRSVDGLPVRQGQRADHPRGS